MVAAGQNRLEDLPRLGQPTDGGDGFGCDWVAWAEPRFVASADRAPAMAPATRRASGCSRAALLTSTGD